MHSGIENDPRRRCFQQVRIGTDSRMPTQAFQFHLPHLYRLTGHRQAISDVRMDAQILILNKIDA
jgi:hypothetical protein